jgi:hypothetical protein
MSPLRAQSLAVVEDVDWPRFSADVQRLLARLTQLGAPLPPDAAKAVAALAGEKAPADPRRSAAAVQKHLDAHCLIGVHINPESRVKAARGARKAELPLDQPTYVLVKVQNEGGVTHPLAVASEQAAAVKPGPGRWVEVGVVNAKPFADRLSGRRVEYRVMRLVARQGGKREATLSFDVGQGTQDLGFRSEVPILFTVRPR